MYDVTHRVNRAVESILENEALTADLDDSAAKVLLDWGIACARQIAQSTAALDDSRAEEPLSSRLRAVRRLMRRVNRWAAGRPQMDAEDSAGLLADIVEQAAIIYGQGFTPPSPDRRDVFLQQGTGEPTPQFIENLRATIESSNRDATVDAGGTNG